MTSQDEGKIKAPISKPKMLKTLDQLNDIHTASLYSLNANFVKDNTKLINNVVSVVQDVLAQNDSTIASSTPDMLVDAIRTSREDKNRQSKKNSETPVQNYLTDIRGLTDQSQDMDLFRELFPIATPMFELFYEYEMVYDMIPEASKCFDILKDAILSSDNFSKNYLIPRYDKFKIDSSTTGINGSAQKHVNLINSIIEEYDLNTKFESYINDAMKYGAKPVMIVPIDSTFRKSAERILRTENANQLRELIRGEYSDGVEVKMEDCLDGVKNIVNRESDEIIGVSFEDAASPYASEFNRCVDELIDLYEDSIEYEASMVKVDDMTEDEKKKFDVTIESKRKTIKRAKDKKNRKAVMEEMLHTIDDMVNKKVKFTYGTEAMVMRDTSKVANQIKTLRKVKSRINKSSGSGAMTMESAYAVEGALEHDIDAVCQLMSNIQYERSETVDSDGVSHESWSLKMPEILDFENSIDENIEDNLNKSKKPRQTPTGSVIIPLQPDTVVPISVHGQHIGYYVIERSGSDDLGSGVATLLGYRTGGASKGFGIGAANLYGANAANTGADGAGVILRDMVDIPMYVKNDAKRIDLLRSMLSRAISERLANPDIVDDKAFNSIIYSLIKDDYITNREIKITYVPAHSMIYFAHEINSDNGVGVSVMQRGLFFAHVYIASLITNLMISIAKSADREQVNVEVGVNNRIEATVQKVMRSMQTKRASIDSIGNVDTIMKSLGTFQRTISLRHNGNPLIELETIPGQQVDLDNSLMEKALNSFINSFYVPQSAVNFLNDTEYARSISLQNALFMNQVVVMQKKYQDCCSKFGRILVRNRYPEKILNKENVENISAAQKNNDSTISSGVTSSQDLINLDKVFLDLPSPEGLNIASLNDQVSNVSTFSDSVVELLVPVELAMDPDKSEQVEQIKNQIKLGIFKKYLPGLPFSEFESIVKTAKAAIEQAVLSKPAEDDGGSSDFGGSDSGDDSGDSDSGGGDFDFNM